jgi:hypothetical protein
MCPGCALSLEDEGKEAVKHTPRSLTVQDVV